MNILSKISKIIQIYNLSRKYDFNRNQHILDILLNKLGNKISSETQQSVDSKSNPIPWFTYPAIEYLNQIDLSNYNILEWGCGNSTSYFSKKCKALTSIESDKEWFKNVLDKKHKNCTIYCKEDTDEYAKYPLTLNQNFDVIVIDGINRTACLNTALILHNKKGFIILDNSDRNPELCKILREENYLEIDFHGFGPINEYTWCTSFFYPSSINVKPIENQPLISAGGGY